MGYGLKSEKRLSVNVLNLTKKLLIGINVIFHILFLEELYSRRCRILRIKLPIMHYDEVKMARTSPYTASQIGKDEFLVRTRTQNT